MPITKKNLSKTTEPEVKDEVIEEVEELEEDEVLDEVEAEDVEEAVDVEGEDEVEEVKPAKKTVKKATAPAKKVVKKAEPATKKSTKPATKPAKKEAPKKEDTPVSVTKAQLALSKKLISESNFNDFMTKVQSGAFEVGDMNTSATRDQFAKMFITAIAETISNPTDENKESATRLLNVLNLNGFNIASAKELISYVESTFMSLIKSQTTFTWGYDPSTGGIKSIKRRTIEGRVKSVNGFTTFIPFHSSMNVGYNVNKEVYAGTDNGDGTFTLEDGDTINIEEANKEAIEQDKELFPRNYPAHLTKK